MDQNSAALLLCQGAEQPGVAVQAAPAVTWAPLLRPSTHYLETYFWRILYFEENTLNKDLFQKYNIALGIKQKKALNKTEIRIVFFLFIFKIKVST